MSGVVQTPVDARENLAVCARVGGGAQRGLVVDIRGCRPLDPPTRHVYSGESLDGGFSRLALVVDATPLGRMMGNLYLRIARPGIPARLFAEPESARAWAMEVR